MMARPVDYTDADAKTRVTLEAWCQVRREQVARVIKGVMLYEGWKKSAVRLRAGRLCPCPGYSSAMRIQDETA